MAALVGEDVRAALSTQYDNCLTLGVGQESVGRRSLGFANRGEGRPLAAAVAVFRMLGAPAMSAQNTLNITLKIQQHGLHEGLKVGRIPATLSSCEMSGLRPEAVTGCGERTTEPLCR